MTASPKLFCGCCQSEQPTCERKLVGHDKTLVAIICEKCESYLSLTIMDRDAKTVH